MAKAADSPLYKKLTHIEAQILNELKRVFLYHFFSYFFFNIRIHVNGSIFALPLWHVAHILAQISPDHWPMLSYTNSLCPFSDRTVVFSIERIQIGILERLFVYKFGIRVI